MALLCVLRLAYCANITAMCCVSRHDSCGQVLVCSADIGVNVLLCGVANFVLHDFDHVCNLGLSVFALSITVV